MLLNQFPSDGLAPQAALDCRLWSLRPPAPDGGLGVASCS
jgi:hypothetical protein